MLLCLQERNTAFVSIGIIEPRDLKLEAPEGGWKFEKGGTLPEVSVRYEMVGTPQDEGRNVIFVCHALTGDTSAPSNFKDLPV